MHHKKRKAGESATEETCPKRKRHSFPECFQQFKRKMKSGAPTDKIVALYITSPETCLELKVDIKKSLTEWEKKNKEDHICQSVIRNSLNSIFQHPWERAKKLDFKWWHPARISRLFLIKNNCNSKHRVEISYDSQILICLYTRSDFWVHIVSKWGPKSQKSCGLFKYNFTILTCATS